MASVHLSLGVKAGLEPPIRCPNHSPLTGAAFVPPQTKPARGTVAQRAQDRAVSVPPLSQVGPPPMACPQGLVAMTSLVSPTPSLATSGKFPLLLLFLPGKLGEKGSDPGKTWGEGPEQSPLYERGLPPTWL